MNEPAIRLEEQIISLFPGVDTLICHGWILKKMERHFCVYPLYYKFSEGNIPDNIQRCEEISCQSGMGCVFRIVEHTNYHLSAILTDTGYVLWKCGIVGELCLPDPKSSVCRAEKGQSRLFLRKGADKGNLECVMEEGGMIIGIKRRELLFLPDGNLPKNVDLEDILQFASINGVKKILADISPTEELPEQYKQAGFNRIYLYRCYQKQEEKSAPKEGGLEDGFTERKMRHGD
ncbi:MAG: hypothetical protein NC331_16925 [Lachnospiraceae bacterium]|nr:hypothetical protein [Lachnospiraceae bacterium]MCM1241027.1 hypothetical protein [Lachnospiraceae bacterium]